MEGREKREKREKSLKEDSSTRQEKERGKIRINVGRGYHTREKIEYEERRRGRDCVRAA